MSDAAPRAARMRGTVFFEPSAAMPWIVAMTVATATRDKKIVVLALSLNFSSQQRGGVTGATRPRHPRLVEQGPAPDPLSLADEVGIVVAEHASHGATSSDSGLSFAFHQVGSSETDDGYDGKHQGRPHSAGEATATSQVPGVLVTNKAQLVHDSP
ncbi:hypothetical protein ABT033_37960 [Streptomyces pharetrae]|uniref:hypothetical protein n=1 Tax=Streptomyces pharetrae TaxID=291370 RepID=UPI00334ACB6B